MPKCNECKESYFEWEKDNHNCGYLFYTCVYHEDMLNLEHCDWTEQHGRDSLQAAERAWKKEAEYRMYNGDEWDEEKSGTVLVCVGGDPSIDLVDGVNVKIECFTTSTFTVTHYSAEPAKNSPLWLKELNFKYIN